MTIGATSLPQATAQLYKDSVTSNMTAISISWDSVAETDLPIIGYRLEVAEFGSEDFTSIFDGQNMPATRSYIHSGLLPGSNYTYRVISMNFNGESAPSQSFTFNACTSPSGMRLPLRVD